MLLELEIRAFGELWWKRRPQLLIRLLLLLPERLNLGQKRRGKEPSSVYKVVAGQLILLSVRLSCGKHKLLTAFIERAVLDRRRERQHRAVCFSITEKRLHESMRVYNSCRWREQRLGRIAELKVMSLSLLSC